MQLVATILVGLASAQAALLQPVPTQTRTDASIVGRRAALLSAAATIAAPFAANASPGSYILGTEEQKFKTTMNVRILPKNTVEVPRKNMYTGKDTKTYQLTGKQDLGGTKVTKK